MSKAEYNPNPTPRWVRDTLVEDEARRWRECGLVPEGDVIERKVVALLERDDARLRERKPVTPPAPKQPKRAEKFAAAVGATLHRDGGLRKPTARERLNPWQLALANRIRQLLKIQPGTLPRDQQFVYPRFAKPYAHELLAWQTGSGKYENLSKPDRDKAFSRYCEDMADASVGVLGQWRKGGV